MAQRLILLLITLLISFGGMSQQQKIIGNQEFSFRSGEWYKKNSDGKYYKIDTEVLTIKFRTNEIHNFLSKHGLSIIRKSLNGYYDVRVPKNSPILEITEQILKDTSIVESIDVNTYGEYGFSPNDTEFGNQWYLTRIGMIAGWDKVKGNSCIQIAVIDSGLDIAHEDIGRGVDTYDNLWQNVGEDAWTDPNNPATGNGIDDDGNGLIDDWRGWDFNALNNDVRSPGNSHGTRVSGIVSAKLNNNRGISGIGGGANNTGLQLMILGSGDNFPSSAAVDDAILYAVQNGADVIQMSLDIGQTAAIDNAIQTAINNGIPVVAASSNGNTDVSYPASNANVIAVGSTNQNDQRSSFSNFGPELFISAPGELIWSTQLGNTYGSSNGTSYAAPQVSAVIGLIRSISRGFTVQQIRDILSNTADKVGGVNYNWDPNRPGHSRELGFGRLNANAALNAVFPSLTGPSFVCTSETYTLNRPSNYFPRIRWEKSSNLSISSSFYPSVTVSKVSNGAGWVRAVWAICGFEHSVTKNVRVGPFTASEISLSGQQAVCPNEYYTYTADVPGGHQPSYTYAWAYPSGWSFDSQGENRATFFTGSGGEGQVRCSVTNSCGSSEYAAMSVFTRTCGFSLAYYPNPAEDELTVSFTESESPYDVRIYDSQANLMYSTTSNQKTITVPASTFPEGRYILNIIHKEGIIQRQIFISR